MTTFVIDLLTAAIILLGAAFVLIGAVGLARLPDIFTRLHGPTKATTLGVGSILIGSIIFFLDPGRIKPARGTGHTVSVPDRAR